LAAWGALSPPLSPTATCGYVGDPKGGGTSPRTERLHNYPALEAPDTRHYIYYPAANYLWSDLRYLLFIPFEVPRQGTSPSQKGKRGKIFASKRRDGEKKGKSAESDLTS